MPLYHGELVFFVIFIFSALLHYLKEEVQNKILSLFYILDVYGSFRTSGDLILVLLRGKNTFKSPKARDIQMQLFSS